MRYGRLTVLFLVVVLAGSPAASPAPGSISAALTGCFEPAKPSLAAATPALAGDAAAAVDALTSGDTGLWAPGAARVVAAPRTVANTHDDLLGAHAGRAPPAA